MTLRQQLAIHCGRLTQTLLKKLTNGGSSLPGKIAKKIDPTVLEALSQDIPVVMISGTNGKTLTTSLTVQILKQIYPTVITNPTGANLEQGIISTFLSAKGHHKKGESIAVLEVDEATLKRVTNLVTPDVLVFTNLFRDQMDRYGEIYSVYDLMLEGAKNSPQATILANGDSPIFHSKALSHPQKFFGFDTSYKEDVPIPSNTDGILCPNCQSILHYHLNTYGNLGNYYCPNCDFKRPELSFKLTKINQLSMDDSSFDIDGESYTLPIAGLYNIYNALAAYSVSRLFGASPEQIRQGFQAAQRVFGRQERIKIGDKEVMIHLTKNPVGINQVIDLLSYEEKPYSLVALLNDNYADGRDVSWIWDANYEHLVDKNRRVIYGGTRSKELKTRLLVSGMKEDQLLLVEDFNQLADKIKELPTQTVHILSTYTTMLALRKTWIQEGYIHN